MTESILLCLATRKGYEVLRALGDRHPTASFRVTTFAEERVVERWDERIRQLAAARQYPVHEWSDIRSGNAPWSERHGVRAVVCVSWIYLVPQAMVDAVGGRVIVAYDSLLPRYRGFAPLATAMIQGDTEVGVTVLLAAEAVDAGDVLFQARMPVGPDETIAQVIDGLTAVIGRVLAGEALHGTPQDHERATYSIWRDEADPFVDWREPAPRIARTVRALGRPYLGARTHLGDQVGVLRDVTALPDIPFEIRQPGKVWSLTPRGEPIIVCGEGLLTIRDAEMDGAPLVPLRRLRVRFH